MKQTWKLIKSQAMLWTCFFSNDLIFAEPDLVTFVARVSGLV